MNTKLNFLLKAIHLPFHQKYDINSGPALLQISFRTGPTFPLLINTRLIQSDRAGLAGVGNSLGSGKFSYLLDLCIYT